METAAPSDAMVNIARKVLNNDFLCERAARLSVTAAWIAEFPELSELACNRGAVRAAAWFHDAWCLDDFAPGRFLAPSVLTTEPDERARNRAADVLLLELKGCLDDATRFTAAAAIRDAGRVEAVLSEAIVLREAVNLDSIGPLWLWGELIRGAAEGKSALAMIALWKRRKEYGYWEERIARTLRFPRCRELARRRCEAMDGYFVALREVVKEDNAS